MMDTNIRRVFTYLYYCSIISGAIFLYFDKNTDRLIALPLYAILTTIMVYHHLHYSKPEGVLPGGKYLMTAELLLALCIQYFDHSVFSGISLIIIISYAILSYEGRFSVPYTLIAALAYIALLYYKSSTPLLLDFLAENRSILIPRAIIIIIFINSRNIIKVNLKNKELALSLQKKTCELESALDKMTAYLEELKETADLRAREQLMNELHDKLGHILATASIGAQATSVLMDKDISAAKLQLDTVTHQIRVAMQSLRNIITGGASYPAETGSTYTDSILNLITETEKLTGISIVHNLSEVLANDLNNLSASKQTFLYNALMEGLTNGLRHGIADRFEFDLKKTDMKIHFKLQDNGTGFSDLVYGYGLTKMKKDAKQLGAQLKITGHAGCTLEISIPIED